MSNVSPDHLAEAQNITETVCVQSLYNVAQRNDDGLIDDVAGQGIVYLPFSRWEDSARYSRRRSMQQHHCRPRQCWSRLRGFFSARLTSY